jgi:hypothetical protein
MYFLIQYDRSKGKLESIVSYDMAEATRAQDDRLAAEVAHLRAGREMEVVLLDAPSIDDLKKTHRRYFEGLDQLAGRAKQ